ncbi:MAG: hypothetical protein GY842_07655, partial [bacterium]|nr:hypothetical protein [bacterium]
MVTESSSKRLWCCGTGAWVIAALVVWACAPSAYAQEACAVLEQDRTFPDCNGDGIEDVDDIAQGTSLDANGNQIPDECDFQICDDLWDGFQPNPPFSYTKQIGLIDYNGDGIYWDDPEGKGSIDKRGCGPNGRLDQTLKIGVHSDNPAAGYVQSEYFRTLAGELDCGASKYSLAFQFKTDVTIASEYDWLYDVFDGVSDSRVVQLAFTSLNSDVDPADRGYVLVKNPAGTPEWINTGVALSLG